MRYPGMAAAILVAASGAAWAGHGHGHGHHGHGPVVSGGVSGLGFGVALPLPGYGYFATGVGPLYPQPGPVEWVPEPPPPRPTPIAPARPARRADPDRASLMVKLGDRHFRAGDVPRAVGRYEQAIRANPASASPRVRLAQVAVSRKNYREAVLRLHEAQAAEPGWLAFADDVQALYREPSAFAALIAGLESHLQAHPEDRDAWMVLGTQWQLSGRPEQAADIFLRLTDRPPDETLSAFLTASRAGER